jgi:hypothetical protein
MKRALLFHVCLSLALIFSLLFAGCNKSDNSSKGTTTGNSSSASSSSSPSSSASSKSSFSNRFVGTWRSVDAAELSLVFKDDGTFMIVRTGSDKPFMSGSYVASGDSVTIKDPENKDQESKEEGTATITDDGRLKFTDETGKAVYYVKE